MEGAGGQCPTVPGCGPELALMSARRKRPAVCNIPPRPLCSPAGSWPEERRWPRDSAFCNSLPRPCCSRAGCSAAGSAGLGPAVRAAAMPGRCCPSPGSERPEDRSQGRHGGFRSL